MTQFSNSLLFHSCSQTVFPPWDANEPIHTPSNLSYEETWYQEDYDHSIGYTVTN